ncbi:MAG TPA: glycerophosphodiester phosphodiesterase family protein [Micromonosporaceae bacterium]
MTPSSPEAPLVFAHRGSSEALPEHTLAAYLRAIDEGADGLECDIRLTRDGHLVCVHDGKLGRTSNGTGRISKLSLAELEELDFGSWHPSWPESSDHLIRPGDLRTRVMTPKLLLETALEAGRPLQVLIETKHPVRARGDVEEKLFELLRAYGLDARVPDAPVSVTVMSFSALAVRRCRELAPDMDTVWLSEFATPGLRSGVLPFGARIAGPGIRTVRANPGIVEKLHRNGNRVFVWTVNEPEDIDLMISLGVDGIISDRPRFVLDRLGR